MKRVVRIILFSVTCLISNINSELSAYQHCYEYDNNFAGAQCSYSYDQYSAMDIEESKFINSSEINSINNISKNPFCVFKRKKTYSDKPDSESREKMFLSDETDTPVLYKLYFINKYFFKYLRTTKMLC